MIDAVDEAMHRFSARTGWTWIFTHWSPVRMLCDYRDARLCDAPYRVVRSEAFPKSAG